MLIIGVDFRSSIISKLSEAEFIMDSFQMTRFQSVQMTHTGLVIVVYSIQHFISLSSVTFRLCVVRLAQESRYDYHHLASDVGSFDLL
ncbi:unnamed protein product [Rodentolepis nana]|uniref:Ovule protein n=1 Tax=Rodentolepis nana TaxID=102285 RepID=A0A0R3TI53_RODNA|nr:unnamed protein product [Rodentolepis nana]